ncbi:P-loop containing nucleoside triphosphate hydrolase protein [Trametopsis cervina]|nr:P-loop containing nucleoside triphosphate hydrolase protein [Trametopsis cervina]
MKRMIVLVIGGTGVGKSSFINAVSGSRLAVSSSLGSCTTAVAESTFALSNRTVTLLDTPGFDDTTRSDIDILQTIASHLCSIYERGDRVHGVIYMHRISDFRITGGSRKTLRMIQHICGDEMFPNILLVTSMWDTVDQARGLAREAELRTDSDCFQPLLSGGARMARYENIPASGKEVVRLLFNNQPLPLLIQRELVDEGKVLVETRAGRSIVVEQDQLLSREAAELAEVRQALSEAVLEGDARAKVELQEEKRELLRSMAQMEGERARLREQTIRQTVAVRRDLSAAVRQGLEEDQQMAQLVGIVNQQREEAAREQVALENRIAELHRGRGLACFGRIVQQFLDLVTSL